MFHQPPVFTCFLVFSGDSYILIMVAQVAIMSQFQFLSISTLHDHGIVRDIDMSYDLTNVLTHFTVSPFVITNYIPRDMIITLRVKLFLKRK